jgi:hypothetical protein
MQLSEPPLTYVKPVAQASWHEELEGNVFVLFGQLPRDAGAISGSVAPVQGSASNDGRALQTPSLHVMIAETLASL